jgi:anti-anti-sigma regulatory factor
VLSPLLIVSTDEMRKVLVITVEGPFTDPRHVGTLRTVMPTVPDDFGLLVDLSWVDHFSEQSLDALCEVARDAAATGVDLTVVCASTQRRAELVLSGLDHHATVAASIEQALPVRDCAA